MPSPGLIFRAQRSHNRNPTFLPHRLDPIILSGSGFFYQLLSNVISLARSFFFPPGDVMIKTQKAKMPVTVKKKPCVALTKARLQSPFWLGGTQLH